MTAQPLLPTALDHVLSARFHERAAAVGVPVAAAQQMGRLGIDLDGYLVQFDGRRIPLSPRQAEILALFLARPDQVWTRQQLQAVCWDTATTSRCVDTELSRIRTRLEVDPFRTVRQRGWVLDRTVL